MIAGGEPLGAVVFTGSIPANKEAWQFMTLNLDMMFVQIRNQLMFHLWFRRYLNLGSSQYILSSECLVLLLIPSTYLKLTCLFFGLIGKSVILAVPPLGSASSTTLISSLMTTMEILALIFWSIQCISQFFYAIWIFLVYSSVFNSKEWLE